MLLQGFAPLVDRDRLFERHAAAFELRDDILEFGQCALEGQRRYLADLTLFHAKPLPLMYRIQFDRLDVQREPIIRLPEQDP